MGKNQYFKDIYDNGGNIPESFDWENMEAGIMDKLETLEQSSESFLSRKQWQFIGSLIGLLLLTGLWICLIGDTKNSDISSAAITKILQEENNEIIEQMSKSRSVADADVRFEKQRIDDVNTVVSPTNEVMLNSSAISKKSSSLTSVANNENPILNQINRVNNTEFILNYEKKKGIVSTFKGINFGVKNQENLEENSLIYHVDDIETLNLLQEINTNTIIDLPLDIEKPKELEEEDERRKKKGSKWSLGVHAGITDWKPNYKGNDLATLKFEAEKSTISYGIQTKLMYDLNDNWQIGSGIEFIQRESRFDFYGERDTTVIQNVVTSIDVNAETGETIIEHREDIPLEAVLWEKVVHHNRYRQFAIPLIVNRKWSLNDKFCVNTGTGIRYVLSANEIGKDIESLLNNASTYKVKDIEPGDYSYKNSLGLLANVSLNYQFSRKWNFGFSTEMNWSLTDVDTQNDIVSKPFGVFTSVGLQYRF